MDFLSCYIVLLLSVSSLTTLMTDAISYTSIVHTESGPIRGQILLTKRQNLEYGAFTGIPYAKAPIKSLRFKPPIKKEKWTDTLDATNDGSYCLQYSITASRIVGSEDCLFLNVFTPITDLDKDKERELKAVMFWIYGGSFSIGSSDPRFYGPDFLIEADVILVTFNYRVGPFGFLNLHHENAVGNAGLKDQNLALQWVNKNIKEFGGDPNKVTIFGQSAGAVSVDLHVLSDMSKELFSQSISMSGSPLCMYWATQSRNEAEVNAFKLGTKMGIRTLNKKRLLNGLYKAPALDIARASLLLGLMPFRPTIESKEVAVSEKFLSECAIDKYSLGNYNKGPHMMGFTSLEALALSDADIRSLLDQGFRILSNASIAVPHKDIDKFTANGSRLNGLPRQIIRRLIEFASDLFFVLGIDTKQQLLQSNNGHPIYYYQFSHNTDIYPRWRRNVHHYYSIQGAGHAEDIPYLFYISDLGLPDDPDVQKTIDRYVKLITNFAKYGNPTPNVTKDPILQISWPESGDSGIHLDINEELKTGFRPISRRVYAYETKGLGKSRILNNCENEVY